MRNLAMVTSAIGKRLNSETGASSSMYGTGETTGTGEENKSTQGGSNYQNQQPFTRTKQFNENSRGDFNFQGGQHILSQTI